MFDVVIDASRYQVYNGDKTKQFDPDKFANSKPEPKLMIYRSTIGDYYTDPYFVKMINHMKQNNIPVSTYMVVDPNIHVSEGATRSARLHVDHLINSLVGLKKYNTDGSHYYELDFPVVIDVEKIINHPDTNKAFYNQLVYDCGNMIEAEFHVKPIIYSSTFIWIERMGQEKRWHAQYEFWMARYGFNDIKDPKPDNFKLPANLTRDNFIMHQVTDKDDGRARGYASLGGDMSYWVHPTKSLQEYLDEFAHTNPEPEPEPIPDPCSCCSIVKQIQDIVCNIK